jgi:hypothetical protein
MAIALRFPAVDPSLTSPVPGHRPPPASGCGNSRNVAITSYNGTHGTIRGPWPTDMYVAAPVIIVRVTSIDHLEQLPDLQRPGEGDQLTACA